MTILDHLTFLYGPDTAHHVLPRVRKLLGRYASAGFPQSKAEPTMLFSGHDAILITYGDMVSEPGIAPLKSLAEFLDRHLAGTVSGVHLLPFYPSSSDDGFAVMDYLAVDPVLGSWGDVTRLGREFDLMFDAVFNHMSSQSDWFRCFLDGHPSYRDFFITVQNDPDLSQVVRPRALPLLTRFKTKKSELQVWTTFSPDQVDLNFKNPEVLLAVLEALLRYVDHGARYIRLDAIAFLWKEIGTTCLHLPQTHAVIQLFRAVLDEVAPEVLLITETNVPHQENLSYFGNGVGEAQMVYNFALPPLVFHTLLGGCSRALTGWAKNLRTPHPRVTFFNFLASHDGIGLNPARGILSNEEIDALVRRTRDHGGRVSYKFNPDGSKSPYELNITYFDALSHPAQNDEPLQVQVDRFMVAQAMMLALAGVPGIYFHSLFGSRNDRGGMERSGIPRRINRQKFNRTELETELRNPESLPSKVLNRYTELLKARSARPAFHPSAAQQILELDHRVFGLLRSAAFRMKIACSACTMFRVKRWRSP